MPCLGPQRPRCRIRFASLRASRVQPLDFSGRRPCWTARQNMGSSLSSRSASQSPNPRGGPHLTERWNQARDVARRIRMGPRAREGSTIWPFCVMSWVPAVTSLRAADRAGSSSSRQFRGSTILPCWGRCFGAPLLSKSCLMPLRCWSTANFCLRQRSEHHFTPSQFLAHFFATEWSPASEVAFLCASWPTVGHKFCQEFRQEDRREGCVWGGSTDGANSWCVRQRPKR